MRGQLSYRRRRRIVALFVLALVAGGVAAAIILLPSGQKLDRGTSSPPQAAAPASRRAPRRMHLTAADLEKLRSTIALFVSTSVARHHPERSWSIVHPLLREGLTRMQWSSGNIPVVPYPAAGVDLLRVESAEDGAALVEIVLAPTSRSHLPHKTFQVELRRQTRAPHRWTISSWVPEGVSERVDTTPSKVAAAAYRARHFSGVWIVVALGILAGSLVLLPVGIFARESFRFRRAKADLRTRPGDSADLRR